ncbi:MAG: hypothetical protein IJ196_07215 [Prevotella sp.]|nr:hypothetical protein [Prevotella sp.]
MLLMMIQACSSIDCPLNSIVQTAYKLQGDVESLPYILTVSTARNDGNDTVLLNQITAVDSFCLPISYQHPEDILYFSITTTGGDGYLDTVTIRKENFQHFTSVDCAGAYFHTITDVSATNHALDSIAIHRSRVTNEINEAHLYIYFKSDL